jgi:hypothetical protein
MNRIDAISTPRRCFDPHWAWGQSLAVLARYFWLPRPFYRGVHAIIRFNPLLLSSKIGATNHYWALCDDMFCPAQFFSDMWRAYPRIAAELEMEHRTVNHSREFVSADGVHTNSIEGTWCGLKLMIPKRNRSANVEDHLWEYIWRKLHRDNVWGSFLEALKSVSNE